MLPCASVMLGSLCCKHLHANIMKNCKGTRHPWPDNAYTTLCGAAHAETPATFEKAMLAIHAISPGNTSSARPADHTSHCE